MTVLTRKTAKMLCVQSALTRSKLPEEAQKLMDLFNDPSVSQEQKQIVKARLDEYIEKIEKRATTRRMKDEIELNKKDESVKE